MYLPQKSRLLPAAAIILAAGLIYSAAAEAAVAVVASRTAHTVEFTILQPDGKARRYSLKSSDVIPIPVTGEVKIVFDSGGTRRQYTVPPNSVHFFATYDTKLDLRKIVLPPPPDGKDPPPPPKNIRLKPVLAVPVMLLADDDEPAVRRLWEQRLRERLAHASTIFERHCRIRFEVVAVGTWVSDDRIVNFRDSLREFELKVNPAPARLAIGFTSQYRIPRGQTHLGGTRGALHSHILIREWAQHVSKTERLEVLVHELGHFLGATHNPEYHSVMRPKIGDHRSHARSFRIGFDPLNTLAMYLVGEQLRWRPVRSLGQLRPDTKAHLRGVYTALAKVIPKDESAKQYLKLLDRSPYVRPQPTRHPESLVKATRVVVRAIVEAARENRSAGPTGTAVRLSGDRLTEFYVRRAAAAAGGLPRDRAAKAFLLGLGIALDHSPTLRYTPVLSSLCSRAESNQERLERLALLGSPTMRGRRDLAQHFFVSSALTVVLGPQAAEAAGLAKELNDSRGRSGFSFVDLSADMAGTTFAAEVRDAKIPLTRLASSFAVKDFLPEGSDLKEGISWQDFLQQYKSAQDARFHRQAAAIRQRIRALPGYNNR